MYLRNLPCNSKLINENTTIQRNNQQPIKDNNCVKGFISQLKTDFTQNKWLGVMSLIIGKLGSFHCERQSDAPLVDSFPTDGFEKFSCIQRCGSIFVTLGTCHCWGFDVQASSFSFIELKTTPRRP